MSRMLPARLLSLSNSQVPFLSLYRSFFGTHGRAFAFMYNFNTRVNEIFRDHLKVSSTRNAHKGFRTFCTAKDLSIKKCVPCDTKDLKPLTEDKANQLLSQVPEWKLINEDGVFKLHRTWKVKSYTKGLEFFQVVADVAEAEGHHPDLHLVGWNNVKIDIWTHSAGGLTENDFILAAKINGLDLHHLLRKKAAK